MLFGVKANVGSNPTVTAIQKAPASRENTGKRGPSALLGAGVRVTPPCYQSTPRLRTSWWMRLLMSSLTNRMRSIPSMPRSEGSSVSHTS